MPDKQVPEWLGEFLTYAWVVGLALFGGTVSYLNRLKAGQIKFSLISIVAELACSAFVGLMTFYLCQGVGLSLTTTAAVAGIAGHMGTRAIFRLEAIANTIIGYREH
ncbi:hypothetical protein IGB42_02652 [Andreprevotia sp. IGB-42]|uniref:phage holin family protein n=1 Tax=Andreprevotia sp. IGB-42 TaxID=2497473 RepID=UPI00135AD6A6|nr:phage holin family protein [Andreprevotia sp. IGB-42]KAF0812809.1 hypothetical protein IGB42_02652 [Andreprevotia sp. IGB-42]